jgi:hypothetical protein
MRKWERIRLFLRVVAAMALAATPLAGVTPLGMVLAAVGAGAGMLSTDLKRDKWTTAELEAHRRRRRPTRSNPLVTPAPVDPKGAEGG